MTLSKSMRLRKWDLAGKHSTLQLQTYVGLKALEKNPKEDEGDSEGGKWVASSIAHILTLNQSLPHIYSSPIQFFSLVSTSSSSTTTVPLIYRRKPSLSLSLSPSLLSSQKFKLFCRAAAEYQFPDPILEFADVETERFRKHLINRLPKKDVFRDSVVGVCTEIFNTFLHTEYGGPGTLLVVPFIDMADTLNERGLPGGPHAARSAVVWAQKHVDKDWNEWTGGEDDDE